VTSRSSIDVVFHFFSLRRRTG